MTDCKNTIPPLSECTVVKSWHSLDSVYDCVDPQSGRPLVWKRVRRFPCKSYMGDPLAEVKRLKLLQHESDLYFPRFLGMQSTSEHVDVALERCSGTDLMSLMLDRYPRGMPEPMVRTIVCAVARALAIMHSRDCNHNDLSLENIVVSLNETHTKVTSVKLIDFGLSSDVPPPGKTHLVVSGSHMPRTYSKEFYAPPEMSRVAIEAKVQKGETLPRRDLRLADMFALGVVLGMLLTRAVYWGSTTAPRYAHMHSGHLRSRESRHAQHALVTGVRISPEAFDLFLCLTRPALEQRMSMEDFWLHPWVRGC